MDGSRLGYRVETWMIADAPRRVHIWTPAAWDSLAHDSRPRDAFYFGGLGYVHVEPPRPEPPSGVPPISPVGM